MKPQRTPAAVLHRLASKVEETQEQRHRQRLDAMFPPRPACERHGWSPPGPGSDNWGAIGSLCPACRSERREAEREQEMPETVTLDVQLPPALEKAWSEHRNLREQAGDVLGGSTIESEMLRAIDEERALEVALLKDTADDRRRYNADYWRRRMHGTHRGRTQMYERHPARAGQ